MNKRLEAKTESRWAELRRQKLATEDGKARYDAAYQSIRDIGTNHRIKAATLVALGWLAIVLLCLAAWIAPVITAVVVCGLVVAALIAVLTELAYLAALDIIESKRRD